MKLSVIIPVFNEIRTIEEILRRVHESPVEKEIIAVDDGSTDGTREALDRLKGVYSELRVFLHERNQGKGAAIRTGKAHITGDVVIIQDADLEYCPEDYPALMDPIQRGYADVVFGTRFIGPHRVFMVWHLMVNKFLTGLTNILYNTMLTDMEVGYKLFRAEVFRSIEFKSKKFDFEPEITAKVFKRGYRVFEVPITYCGRGYDEGKKITWKDAVAALVAIFRYRFFD